MTQAARLPTRILIIDDDRDIWKAYRLILSPDRLHPESSSAKISLLLNEGADEQATDDAPCFALSFASQGQEGYQMIEEAMMKLEPFAMAFIDVRMPPGWDGMETAIKIRQFDPQIELVIVTAYSDRSMEEIVRAVGASDKLLFVRKPFDPEELKQIARCMTSKWQIANLMEQQRQGRQLLEEQLRQAQKMESIGTLAGGIAHDFNNLLSPIIGYSELLLLGRAVDSTITKPIQEILTAANRAKELVKQILTFSRRSEQKLAPLIVAPVIKEALKLLRSSIPSSIEIQQNINPECGAVLADPVQIHQIIMNLCTNAYQSIVGQSGIISVSLSPVILAHADIASKVGLQPGHYLKLVVEDSGEGIDQESLKRIFEPYFTTKEKGKGTGLGLAVVHGIVKNYGGEINVYSEPGKGTRFNIYLPVVSTETPQEKENREKPLQTGTEKLLLVDDEEQITQHVQTFLETLGYQVTSCNDPTEALSLFSNDPNRFDLIITDMTMPKMSGALLSQKLLTARKDLPIIICTGFSETMDKETAKQLGIRAFLMKPVSSHDLAATIRTVLDTK